jgi:hypothetical protein
LNRSSDSIQRCHGKWTRGRPRKAADVQSVYLDSPAPITELVPVQVKRFFYDSILKKEYPEVSITL